MSLTNQLLRVRKTPVTGSSPKCQNCRPPKRGERLNSPRWKWRDRGSAGQLVHLERTALLSRSVNCGGRACIHQRVVDSGSHRQCWRSEKPSPRLPIAQIQCVTPRRVSHSISWKCHAEKPLRGGLRGGFKEGLRGCLRGGLRGKNVKKMIQWSFLN